MSAYKCDVVVVIKMGAYIQGVLILCGCLLSRFYGNDKQETLSHVHYCTVGSTRSSDNSVVY